MAVRRAQPGVGDRGWSLWDVATVLVTQRVDPRRRETRVRWVVALSPGQLAFRLSSYSAQAARLRRDRQVIVQPGDLWGIPSRESRPWRASVELLDRGEVVEAVEAAMAAKYGWRLVLSRWAHRWSMGPAPYADLVAVVTVHGGAGTGFSPPSPPSR